MIQDTLSNALSKMNNAEKSSKTEVSIKPSSKQLVAVLEILKKEKYIADFKLLEDNRGGEIIIQLNNKINKINSIKPRYMIKKDNFEKFEKRYLPAKDFGRLIISTTKGFMTHLEAKEKGRGGALIAYVY